MKFESFIVRKFAVKELKKKNNKKKKQKKNKNSKRYSWAVISVSFSNALSLLGFMQNE